MLATPDQQISLTDPDARSMATSGRGSGVVGYNVQVAVDTAHHMIIAHEVTNVGTDRSQLSSVAKDAKATLGTKKLDAVADRGYFSSEQILACEEAGITVTLPKPMTSHSKAEGRFGKQDFRYEDATPGCRRDGVTRAGLRYDAGHEHHGHQTANCGDEGVVPRHTIVSALRTPPLASSRRSSGCASRV